MRDVTFEVPFVRGKQRPRFVRKTGRAYTPDKTLEGMEAIRRAYIEAGGEMAPDNAPVYIHITTARPVPKSRPKKVECENDIYKPDIDNIGKLVLDALTGTAYPDDSQVVELNTHKCPRVRDMREHTLVWIHWEEEDE